MPDLDVAIPSRVADDGPWPSGGEGRTIRRRRSLPGGRAVIGGFLIAAAAVITFGAYTGATRPSRQLYVVAARPLVPGARITAADLRVVALDLPDPAVRRQVFGSVDGLVGASVLAPIAPGALVEASEVVGRGGARGTREISVSIDSSRAVGGTLKAGERRLEARDGGPVTAATIVPYWHLVIADNRDRAPDPNLIYDGQLLRVPTPP